MKTRNLFLSMLAIAGMLATTSCEKESIEVPAGNEVVATFTINATDAIATRTIGDGTTVDVVTCAVYDANGAEMTELRKTVPVSGKTAYYQVRLAKGQAYRVAFFAYNEAANAYDVTDMKNIKINPYVSNVEARDAFTNIENITAEQTANGAIDVDVYLYRPFAQLNLGVDATELEDARMAGVVVTNSKIVVTNVYNAFSAYDNAIPADAVAGTCEFGLNGIPTEKLVVNGAEYTYLALNYILVGDKGAEKSLSDVEFVWTTADGKRNNPTTHFINIPVQRNYRTNIIGNLLTNPANFNIYIDDEFDGQYVENIETVLNKTVSNATELQAAINNAVVGQNYITLGANVGGAIVVNQKKDVQILIDGQGKTFTGTILVNGGSQWGSLEGLSLQNINFAANTMSGKVDIITVGADNATRYAHNIIISDCTFVPLMSGTNAQNSVVLRAYQANDVRVVNCEANGFHSFAQITGGANVKFEGITSTCVRGISLGSAINCGVSNCTITATGAEKYGVRHSADSGVDRLMLINNTIDACFPVVVRHTNDTPVTDYTLAFEGNNTLVKGDVYDVAISEDEYDTLGQTLVSLPNVTVTGADASWVIFQ